MTYRVLADAVALLHAAFVVFVVVGGLLVVRWPRLAVLHVPAAIWGALIEFGGWICPLTPLENHFRDRAGEAGYTGGFVEHYVLRALYPAGLTRSIQWTLGCFVIAVNTAAYVYVVRTRRRRHLASTSAN
jgi:uncharacterized protein DUF2784